MPIFACGINHKTAPIALREKVVFAPDKLSLYLNDLLLEPNCRQAVLLSTCNRSEIYCDADDKEIILNWFCQQHALSRQTLDAAFYIYQDEQAIQHIMQVACGLDSMVLGEAQILGQMKQAFSESCAAGAIDTLFNRLFQQVFAVAKEVRTHTAIGACPVSVSSATVRFLQHIYPAPLKEATLLLLGAGSTIELLLRHLQTHSIKHLTLVNRSEKNAERLAEKYAASVIPFDQLSQGLAKADILISATGSPVPVVTKKMLLDRAKPLCIIDIAVPRDVEPEVNALANIELHSIDDLKIMIQQNRQGREHAAEKAREMIQQKSHVFMQWLTSMDKVSLTIRAYRKQIEELCQAELAKAMHQLKYGNDPIQVLASFSHALTNKLLHAPSVQLRQAGVDGRLDILQWAQQLFAISDPQAELI